MLGTVNQSRRGSVWQIAIACYATLVVVSLLGCGSDAPNIPGATTAKAGGGAAQSENFDEQHPTIKVETSLGKIVAKLDAVKAPSTVRNFLNYASEGYYQDTLFHYVEPNKMIVGGGYSVDGQPKPAGSTVRNEAHNGLTNSRGTIAMARDPAAGIDNATSQFFINLVDSPSFDHRGEESSEYGYCVFGEIVEGLDVADKISQSSTRDQGGDLAQTPVPPVVIKSISVVK